jgi:effector-binding domain-containing protein
MELVRTGMAKQRSTDQKGDAMSETSTHTDGDRDTEGVAVAELEAQPVLSIRGTVDVARLAEAQGERLREVWRSVDAGEATPAGPPFVRYHTFGEAETDLEVGIPVVEQVAGGGRAEGGELPGGTAITTWHIGSHDELGDAYGRLDTWLTEHGRARNGAAWEVYWWIGASQEPDPSTWPPPAEWRTELVQPIAGNP